MGNGNVMKNDILNLYFCVRSGHIAEGPTERENHETAGERHLKCATRFTHSRRIFVVAVVISSFGCVLVRATRSSHCFSHSIDMDVICFTFFCICYCWRYCAAEAATAFQCIVAVCSCVYILGAESSAVLLRSLPACSFCETKTDPRTNRVHTPHARAMRPDMKPYSFFVLFKRLNKNS